MATNAAGRTIWNDKTRSDLLQAIIDVAPPNATEWSDIIARLHAQGYTYNCSAALQHLQKLKKKEGPSAPSTPKKAKATAGNAKTPTSRKRNQAQRLLNVDKDEDEDMPFLKKVKTEQKVSTVGEDDLDVKPATHEDGEA
ncbi:hypothetical protein F5Y03DRAFT_321166 [Xylaria venustula]|nr:hypothetical protein F5Y03DRAFT_321166 [Xylaria venustula]